MEEMVHNLNGARRIFERWMEWQPDDQAWYSYIKLELRANEIERARQIYERYVQCHPAERSYLKFAKWEEKHHQFALARKIYERAMEEIRDDERTEKIYVAFAAFEERCREFERARFIFKFALDKLPKSEAPQLYNAFIRFEKQHGDRKRIEDVVIAKRRVHYEQQISVNPLDYDSWLEFIKLEEAEATTTQAFGLVREIYERAIANVPPLEEKKYWRRYIYLWIKYALFEELQADDAERCKQVYIACIKIIPHDKFTFAKIWILYAKFLIRQRDLVAARQVLGQSIGQCPKKKLFRCYIDIEFMMGEIDRCRAIYEKFLFFEPHNCEIWQKFAQLESNLGEIERARAIYELAIKQPVLDMPEMIWKAFIDFEIENEQVEATRALYERLLERTKHVKVWVSFAQFEAKHGNDGRPDLDAARDVFDRALRYLKEEEKNEERASLLETWLECEKLQEQNDKQIKKLQDMQPRKVTKQRMAYDQDGVSNVNECNQQGFDDVTLNRWSLVWKNTLITCFLMMKKLNPISNYYKQLNCGKRSELVKKINKPIY
jgi:crooked neck